MAKSKIHVGLEIGTSMIRMLVGEVREDGSVAILGVGEVPTHGVIRGEIEDIASVMQGLYSAWSLAQDNAEVDILTVYLAVTGMHIKGENHTGSYRLPADESIISEEHKEEVLRNARDAKISNDRFVLHRVPGLYALDNQQNLLNPCGLTGKTLDLDCHVIHGIKSRITNSFNA